MSIGNRMRLMRLLTYVGLRRRRRIAAIALPIVGLIAFGAAVGATMGLAFAPSSGRRLRAEVGDRLDQIRERAKTELKREADRPGTSPS